MCVLQSTKSSLIQHLPVLMSLIIINNLKSHVIYNICSEDETESQRYNPVNQLKKESQYLCCFENTMVNISFLDPKSRLPDNSGRANKEVQLHLVFNRVVHYKAEASSSSSSSFSHSLIKSLINHQCILWLV